MKNIKLFKLIGFLRGLYFYAPIFAIFLLSKNIPLSAVVFSQIFYSVLTFLGEIPTGVLADKFGQKISIILGYLIESVGVVAILFFPTTAGLYVATGIRGLANSFLSGSEEALLYESVRHVGTSDFKKQYAHFISNRQIGFIICTTLTGIIYKYAGSSAFGLLIGFSGLCILGAAVSALFLTDHTVSVDSPEGSHMFVILRESLGLIRRNATIFTFTIVGVLTLSGQYFLQSVYSAYFELRHVPAFWIGAVLSIGTLLNIILTRRIHFIEKHLTVEKILLAVNLILGFSYISMAVLKSPLYIVGLYILMNGVFNLQTPIVSDYINSRTKSSIRTTVLSGISFVQRFFQVFLTWVLGICVGAFGAQVSLIVQGAYLIIGICIGYYLLIYCGCTYKVNDSDGEELQFT